jgi:nucleoside-diphosphate-sugar epimerase
LAGVDTSKITEVFHLAAVYDLAVSREIGMKVNVEGTRNVLDWAESCQNLKRFHHVSTCYVSGRYCGIFRESDLDKGQRFNNYYEETKFLSEVDVASRQSEGLPTTIYRPAITVGDSVTGSTQKYDGVYFFTSLLLRQPRWLSVLPIVGDQDATRVNLVSSDFVVQAIAELSSHSESLGRVYQLADPNPLTVREVIDSCARCTGRNPFKIQVPKGLARWSLKNIKLARKLLGLPAEAIDYFVLPTHYTSDNTVADLEGTGIAARPLTSYFQTLVDFQMANPHGAVGPML